MIELGRLCMKIAGRDAGRRCLVIEVIDDNYVMIDGATRRRKCNIAHLEPLAEKVKISKGASHEAVKKELEKLSIKTRETKPKQKTERPKKQKKQKLAKQEKPKKEEKLKKKEKKTEEKAEKKETKAKEAPKKDTKKTAEKKDKKPAKKTGKKEEAKDKK